MFMAARTAPPAARSLAEIDLDAVAEALRTLAHPLRLRIVDLLMRKRHSVGDLAETLGEPQAVVSQHLAQLRARGVLDVHREGRSAFYFVIHPAAENVIRCIRKHAV